jgi:hypothetical protein
LSDCCFSLIFVDFFLPFLLNVAFSWLE